MVKVREAWHASDHGWTWLSNWTTTCWPGRKVSLQIRKNYDLYSFTQLIFIVAFQSLVMSDSLQSHRLQHDRLPCPSLSPRVCSNSCPLSWWCYTTISSSATSFFCPQSFSASVFSNELALHIRWSKLLKLQHQFYEYSGLIFFRIHWFYLLGVQRTLKSPLQHQIDSINSSALSLLYGPTSMSIHDYWKNRNYDYYGLLSAKRCLCAFLS